MSTDTARAGRRPGRTVEAVLIDMDGLLVDTEPLWTVAEEELAARLGGTWSPQLKARIVGTRVDTAVPAILQWYGVATSPQLVAETTEWLLARMVELFAEQLTPLPGAARLLGALHERAVPTALVSSSYRRLVDAVLARLGAQHFATTLAGDEVVHAKPHPEPYLTAAARLGADPRRCVVLEDAPAGVAAAETAGCVAVAVPSVTPIEATRRRPVLASLEQVDLDWLLSLTP